MGPTVGAQFWCAEQFYDTLDLRRFIHGARAQGYPLRPVVFFGVGPRWVASFALWALSAGAPSRRA
eukprot:4426197-Lingulodinium_polyedra.AAC.1